MIACLATHGDSRLSIDPVLGPSCSSPSTTTREPPEALPPPPALGLIDRECSRPIHLARFEQAPCLFAQRQIGVIHLGHPDQRRRGKRAGEYGLDGIVREDLDGWRRKTGGFV